jgi:hypothetical protein
MDEAGKVLTPERLRSAKEDLADLEHPPECELEEVAKGIQGCFIGYVGHFKVYSVIADQCMIHGDMDWTTGGNHFRWPFCPENQLWLSHDLDPCEARHDCLHEFTESILMDELGWEYDKAHDRANEYEREYMKELGLGKPIKEETSPGKPMHMPWEK